MPMNEDAEAIAYLTAERDKLARDLAACKIARDGWIKASDEAHARIRELEAALAEARQLLSVYRVQRDHAEAALAPPTPQDRGGEP